MSKIWLASNSSQGIARVLFKSTRAYRDVARILFTYAPKTVAGTGSKRLALFSPLSLALRCMRLSACTLLRGGRSISMRHHRSCDAMMQVDDMLYQFRKLGGAGRALHCSSP